MKRGLFVIIMLLINIHVFASIITVKQDGTGDYTTIQAAVDDIYQTDTILVWPGTYYENVVIDGSCLTLASLSLTTGDPSYRNTTIIDGGQNGSCIAIFPVQQWLKDTYIHGFTLQNGSGTNTYDIYTCGGGVYIGKSQTNKNKTKSDNIRNTTAATSNFIFTGHVENCIIKNNRINRSGGGIYVDWYSEANITNCVIKDNEATYFFGGGVYCELYSTLRLSNTSIFRNISTTAGGLGYGYGCIAVFDSLNRCSIYNNFASWGCDIETRGDTYQIDIYLDTFSVLQPERYFAYFSDNEGYYNDDSVSIDVQHGWLEPLNNDLYVDPIIGNDENSGLDSDDALKTINFAYRKIAIDSINPNTIHLANGTYSDSANNELFPFSFRQFVNLRGELMDSVILDGNYLSSIIRTKNGYSDYKISKIKLIRGGFPYYVPFVFYNNLQTISLYQQGENITFDSIILEYGWCNSDYAHLGAGTGNNFTISNSIFRNNTGGTVLGASGFYTGDTSYIENCIIANNAADTNHPDPEDQVLYALTLGSSKEAVTIVTNCLIADNENFTFTATSSLHGNSKNKENHFVNCTFVNNSKYYGHYAFYMYATSNSFYNCVIHDNSLVPDYLALADWNYTGQTVLNMNNTLIENGINAIRLEQPDYITVNYDHHTNIDEDPNFLGMWNHPYMIADGSPCINTGTLANLPDFIVLPETDLAGNPRIVGDSIDMGCYEWNSTIVGFNEIGPGSEKEKPKLITASPNPFGSSTRISIKYKSEETVKVEIYDSFGHRVKTMLNSSLSQGNYELKWDGTDNNGNHLPQGVYFVIMFSGEKEVESLKVVKR